MKKLHKRLKPKSSQFILTVGDEGAILVHLKEGKVERRLYAASSDPSHTSEFEKMLAQDTNAPTSLLVDMMDQSYVQQSLPPVSPLSINSLIKRRLERDFAPEDIKGAISLGRDKQGRKDWNFLLISLAFTPQLSGWLKLIIDLPNRFEGIFLVPVESSTLLDQLSKSVNSEENRQPSKWQLLVNHSKVGGFRQVVFKDGKMIFTRLAQPIGELVPEVVAGNIEQEVINTVEYLKRLSYQEQDGLDVYIVVSQEIKNAIDGAKIKATYASVLTPYEVAVKLDIQQAALPGDSFGDVVMACCFGNARKHQLKLSTDYSRVLERLYNIGKGLRAAAALMVFGVFAYSIYEVVGIAPLYSEIDQLSSSKTDIEQSIVGLQAEAAKLPDSLSKITDIITVYENLFTGDASPQSMVAQLSKTLTVNTLVQSINWQAKDFTLAEPALAPGTEAPPEIEASFDVQFSHVTNNLDDFLNAANGFLDNVRSVFSMYNVTNAKLPGTLAENETLQVTLGASQGANTIFKGEPVVVKINISGPVTVPPSGQPATP